MWLEYNFSWTSMFKKKCNWDASSVGKHQKIILGVFLTLKYTFSFSLKRQDVFRPGAKVLMRRCETLNFEKLLNKKNL